MYLKRKLLPLVAFKSDAWGWAALSLLIGFALSLVFSAPWMSVLLGLLFCVSLLGALVTSSQD